MPLLVTLRSRLPDYILSDYLGAVLWVLSSPPTSANTRSLCNEPLPVFFVSSEEFLCDLMRFLRVAYEKTLPKPGHLPF